MDTSPGHIEPIETIQVGISMPTIEELGKHAHSKGTTLWEHAKEIIKELKKKKIMLINITLHVGMGTFLPLKSRNIKENILHKEKGIISKSSANLINKSIKEGKKIVAVGTTVMRLLESCYAKYGKIQYFVKSQSQVGTTISKHKRSCQQFTKHKQ